MSLSPSLTSEAVLVGYTYIICRRSWVWIAAAHDVVGKSISSLVYPHNHITSWKVTQRAKIALFARVVYKLSQ